METLDKTRATALIEKVQSILWNAWDPIGVRRITEGGPWPDDEYNSYAPSIAGMIWKQDSIDRIADFLDWAVHEHMGMTVDRGATRARHEELAQQLLKLKAEIESE
jgi:hypothetical protein